MVRLGMAKTLKVGQTYGGVVLSSEAEVVISREDLEHINDVIMKNLVYVPMSHGDVVLVDNYQVMHGRDVFEGERLHAVTWFQ